MYKHTVAIMHTPHILPIPVCTCLNSFISEILSTGSLENLFKELTFSFTFSTKIILVFDTEDLCFFLPIIQFLVPESQMVEMLGLLSFLCQSSRFDVSNRNNFFFVFYLFFFLRSYNLCSRKRLLFKKLHLFVKNLIK